MDKIRTIKASVVMRESVYSRVMRHQVGRNARNVNLRSKLRAAKVIYDRFLGLILF